MDAGVAAVRAHLAAESRQDLDGAMAVFAPDCRYAIPALGVRLHGHDAVRDHHARMLAAFPDLRNVELACHEARERVFVRLRVERHHRGPWAGIPPTGRRVVTEALAEFELAADGLIAAEVVHLDPLDALWQIGALPTRDPFELAAATRPRWGAPASAAAAPAPAGGHGLLAGRRAIVTGGGRGIGAGIAATLAREGAAVGLVGRDADALAATAATLGEQADVAVATRVADLADGDAAAAAVTALAAELGGVDVLVNNAGTTVRDDALALSLEAWDRVLAVNLRGAFACAQAAARAMVADGAGGAIVNIASLSARFGIRRAPAYAASKGGIVQLTRALALEWGAHGIRVNAVAPGYVATDLTAPLVADAERRARIDERIPLGRWGTPADVGGAVALLCSPLAAYVTGQVLYVDGGYGTDG